MQKYYETKQAFDIAFRQGRKARTESKPSTSNPKPQGTDAHRGWEEGWSQLDFDLEQGRLSHS